MMKPQQAEFDNFQGQFTLIRVDTDLYNKYGKFLHEEKGLPIQKVDEFLLAVKGVKLILGRSEPAHNLMVMSGRILHASLMVDDVTDFSGHLFPTYIHVGSGTNPPAIDDWKLETPWATTYAISPGGVRDSMSHCYWDATIPPTDTGTIAEAGLFLQAASPAGSPVDDPASYAQFSMLHRALFPTPIVKGATTEIIQYEAVF